MRDYPDDWSSSEDDDGAPLGVASAAVRAVAARARALIGRQLKALERLAAKGAEIARGLAAQAEALAPTHGPVRDLVRLGAGHARIVRAVMIAILLQSRLIAELGKPDIEIAEDLERPRHEAELQGPAEDASSEQVLPDEDVHKAARRLALDEPLEGEPPEGEPVERENPERLADAKADQRALDRLVRYVQSRPVEALIEEICRTLGLSPEWLRWAMDAPEDAPEPDLPPPGGRGLRGGAARPPSSPRLSARPPRHPQGEDPG